MSFWKRREEERAGELLVELGSVVSGSMRHRNIVRELELLGVNVKPLEPEPSSPPFVTVADCGHCFEDVGERA